MVHHQPNAKPLLAESARKMKRRAKKKKQKMSQRKRRRPFQDKKEG
jgi:hypothetical protein